MKNLLFSGLFLLACPLFSFAQGTISGTILDEKYAEPLIGANVVIEGTAIGTSTDFDGKYQFTADPGVYNLVISYIGYNDKTISEVEVKDGEVTYLDAALSDEAVDLALDVVVSAKSLDRSENALLMLQKKSDKIQDGISSQEMSRFSVSDAAGAMKKVTGATVSGGKYIYIRGLGDRYSLTQLNGLIIPSADPYRNGAQLDLIPANLLENIITAKTFTPDQPGTFTGGNVDIRTKSFPEQFSLSFSASTAFNPQNNLISDFLTHQGGANDYWGYDDGGRAEPDLSDPKTQAVLGYGINSARLTRDIFYRGVVEPTGVFDSNEDYAATVDRLANSFNTEFTPDPTNVPVDHSMGVSFGNQYNIGSNPLGVIASASFNKSYNHLGDFLTANWILDNFQTGTLLNQGDFEETKSTESATVNGMVGLAYKLGSLNTITFNAIYNHSADKITRDIFGERPDNLRAPIFLEGRSLAFIERELVNFQLGGEHIIEGLNKAKIEWKASRAISSQLEPDTRFFENDFNATTGQSSIPASDVQVPFHFFRDLEDEQYDAKLDITIPFSDKPGNKIKFGGLYSQKDRVFNESRYQLELQQGVGQDFTGDPDVYLSDANYGLIENSPTQIGVYVIDQSLPRNNYTGQDKVMAFYGMVTLALTEQLKFIGGARYEKTDLFAESADPAADVGRIDVEDILPSANLVYSLTENMNLRASFSQTLARPNMREIAPFEAFDPLQKLTYFGNPNLTRTQIDNYDLRWEYFFRSGEILAVSGYYKRFEDPITLAFRRAPNPEIQFVNVDEANLLGVEFEFRKSLDFITPALKDFKFITNLSLINSESDVFVAPGLEDLEPESRPFEGQSPFILNAALVYSNLDQGIDATLSINSIGDRLEIIGREGTPDLYNRGRSQLDFSFIKKFGNLNVKVTARNLLDADFRRSSDFFDNEFIYSLFNRGRTFGLGLSYTIK
ncbi:MAG: TonB-dependent receptor [Bacteroidota bacterium]